MTPTATRLPPVRLRRKGVLGVLLGAAGVAAVLLAVAPALRSPVEVAALTIDNPTVYQVNVEVGNAGRDGWLDLGAVGRERAKTVEEVADQGDQWVFRFSYGGVDAGELVVGRAALASQHWKVTIPAEAGQRLHDAGLAPSAF